jgi:hypothetical protein
MIDGVRKGAPLRALPRAWVGTTGEDRSSRARMLAGGEAGMFLPRPLSQVKAVDRTRQWEKLFASRGAIRSREQTIK